MGETALGGASCTGSVGEVSFPLVFTKGGLKPAFFVLVIASEAKQSIAPIFPDHAQLFPIAPSNAAAYNVHHPNDCSY